MESDAGQGSTNVKPNTPILRSFSSTKSSVKKGTFNLVLATVLVVLAGLGTGWLLSGNALSSGDSTTVSDKQEGEMVNTASEAGIEDESAFPDTAEGTLKEGGIDGEGTHYLERPGGTSQNVYLFSTVIDLRSFVDKKVQIWGKTVSGKEAGWLMDVGRIKVVE